MLFAQAAPSLKETPLMRTPTTDDITRMAKDAVYIAVGLGVLTVEQLDARRREVAEALSQQFDAGREQVEQILKAIESQLCQADERLQAFETRLDTTLDSVRERLPEPAGELFARARSAATTARTEVRERLRRDAA
jgi:hypothetical protein